STAATLCGRNAVQVSAPQAGGVNLEALAEKLSPVAEAVAHNRFLLRARVDGYDLTLFPDGRAIIKGTDDADKARSLYARYFGS
ncbi:MAG: thiazole biosynthesis adenylyltransferase ThiF, partial [Phycisphaerae bacterium]